MMTSLPSPGAQPGSPLVAIRGLTVRYEDRRALNHVDFTLQRGQSVLVVGASGSGKSTLAMVVAGLIPDSVEAEIEGSIDRDPVLNKPGRVGYIFQDPESQFCQLTVGQEIAFGLENMRVDRSRMDPRIADALRAAHLAVSPSAYDLTLSGGMKQKLAMAAALAQDPEVVVFDEPTANLDPQGTAEVFHEIRRLQESGRTLLVIEHKFLAFLDLLPQVVLIDRGGKVRAEGPTRDVMDEQWPWLVQEGLVPGWWKGIGGAWGQPAALGALAAAHRAPEALESAGPDLFEARGLRFAYGKRKSLQEVLHGLDFRIHAGEKLVIVGPNGSGKSTLLALLAGLSKPSAGELTRPVAREGMPVPVVLGFQNPEHQFVYERVADELADGYVGDEMPAKVAALLKQFGLEGYESHSPFSLSQGQKRRLAVAVMIKDDHLAYILDEPTFGQDARTQEAIVTQLETLNEQGRTVIITTHDMELAARFASRVMVLIAGDIAFDGSPEELFANTPLMERAHLLPESSPPSAQPAGEVAPDPATRGWSRFAEVSAAQKRSWMGQLNPSVKLIATMLAMGIAMFAANIPQAVALAALPLILLGVGAKLTPGQIAKRMAPFVIFFILYTWTLTAYSRVGPHTPVFYFLWYRLSWTGLDNGLVLAFRMLASVAFGVLFISTTDLTDLIVSLSQNLQVPPRFSYGSLAGIRVFPLFEDEWRKIRQARQLRGREGRFRMARIVTYALPLLSQAIRMGERVSIAMEARGFKGAAAQDPKARTYYRDIPVRWGDGVYILAICAVSVVILVLIR